MYILFSFYHFFKTQILQWVLYFSINFSQERFHLFGLLKQNTFTGFHFFFYFLALEEKPITFFIFSGKYNNNIREGKNKTYMKAEITVDVSSLVFALWSSHKSLTLRGLKHLVYETKTFKSSYFESHDIPTEHFRDSRVTGFLFYFYI